MVMDHGTDACEVRGSMTALVTPFRNGRVDESTLVRLIDRQIEGGTDWLVPLGTTGESPTLSDVERDKILSLVIEQSAGRCPVMAGTGSNNTAQTVERTRRAERLGAAAALVVTPCYNRPTPEGLFRHFAAVAESVSVPIVLYDVPARTGVCLDHDVVVRLHARFRNIVAIKDATGCVDHVTALERRCDISVLSGDDALTWPFLALGAVGVVSVIGNLAPTLVKTLVRAGLERNAEQALAAHRRVYDLATALGRFGPNPIPIKTAMAICGLLAEEFRLPLCPIDADPRKRLKQVLRRHELLESAPA